MGTKTTFILAPASAPNLQDFFIRFPAISLFFEFHDFTYSERQAASLEYKRDVLDHALSTCIASATNSMVADWHQERNMRSSFWNNNVKAKEKQARLLVCVLTTFFFFFFGFIR